jgi:hypothetical protein
MNPIANILNRQLYRFLFLFLFLPGVSLWYSPALAQDETPDAMPANEAAVDPCLPVREVGDKGSEKEEPVEFPSRNHDCKTTSSTHLPRGNRQEISEVVSENIQNALTLKQLLLGRSYTFFGNVEPEYAAYFNLMRIFSLPRPRRMASTCFVKSKNDDMLLRAD